VPTLDFTPQFRLNPFKRWLFRLSEAQMPSRFNTVLYRQVVSLLVRSSAVQNLFFCSSLTLSSSLGITQSDKPTQPPNTPTLSAFSKSNTPTLLAFSKSNTHDYCQRCHRHLVRRGAVTYGRNTTHCAGMHQHNISPTSAEWAQTIDNNKPNLYNQPE